MLCEFIPTLWKHYHFKSRRESSKMYLQLDRLDSIIVLKRLNLMLDNQRSELMTTDAVLVNVISR
jgi:hypothetical protein